jgi:hypothetical protein
MARYALGRRDDDWYVRLFPARGTVIRGEITPSYCALEPSTIIEIRARVPNLKLVLMLRDPIERAWSAAAKRLARQEGRHVRDVPEAELREYFDRPPVRAVTDYTAILEKWRSIFDRDSIFVGFLDDLHNRPEYFFDGLAAHLGVDAGPLQRAEEGERPVNTTAGFRSEVPETWERYLAGQYVEVSGAVADEFGGPAVAWYERAVASLAA